MKPLIPRSFLLVLLIAALLLPVVCLVLYGAAALFTALGDAAGGGFTLRLAQAGAVTWAIDLILLVVVQALGGLARSDEE